MNTEKINKHLRLSIANKILAGYLLLSLILIIISVYAFITLKNLQQLNESIINEDIKIIESSKKIVDDITTQEIYARKYLILRSRDMLSIFEKRINEINDTLKQMKAIVSGRTPEIDAVLSLYSEYIEFNRKRFIFRDTGTPEVQRYDRLIRHRYDRIINLLDKIISDSREQQNKRILSGLSMSNNAIRFMAGLCIAGLLAGVFTTFLITRNISGSINRLKLATKEISEGKFDYQANPSQNDELGELSFAFAEMARRLKKLEEMYLDTSPLTRLPGGIAIENVLKDKIEQIKSLDIKMEERRQKTR